MCGRPQPRHSLYYWNIILRAIGIISIKVSDLPAKMAPKTICNPSKLASVVTYLRRSRVAHSIKDLEKHLPSVASINGMQVKDYLQALSDDNRISVEKIGAGNWYWIFAAQELKTREAALETACAAHAKQLAAVEDLRARQADAVAVAAQRIQDEEEAATAAAAAQTSSQDTSKTVETRASLLARQTTLSAEIAALRGQIAAYTDDENHPAALQDKKAETQILAAQARSCTDDIYSLEGWFRGMGAEEHLAALKEALYGDQGDGETGELRDLD